MDDQNCDANKRVHGPTVSKTVNLGMTEQVGWKRYHSLNGF